MANNRGGVRPNAGRKPKASEIELIEKLSPMDATAFKQLEQGVKAGEFAFIKLFFEYRFGKPKEKVDVTSLGEGINTIRVIRE
jgi:hypothetical protein